MRYFWHGDKMTKRCLLANQQTLYWQISRVSSKYLAGKSFKNDFSNGKEFLAEQLRCSATTTAVFFFNFHATV